MRLPEIALLCLLGPVGCAGQIGVEEAGAEAEIVNGRPDTGHPEVGMLLTASGGCTATLVGLHSIVTAVHCLYKSPGFEVKENPVFILERGERREEFPVVRVVRPQTVSADYNRDLAYGELARDAAGVRPALTSGGAPRRGESVAIVGYGITGEQQQGSYGTRRITFNTIGDVDAQRFTYYRNTGAVGGTCYGDSGGPTFARRGDLEYLIGVHSRSTCEETRSGQDVSSGIDARVDAHRFVLEQGAGDDLYAGGAYETARPSTSITLPAGEPQAGEEIEIAVQASDDIGVRKIEVFAGELIGELEFSGQKQVSGTVKLRVPVDPVRIEARAYDRAEQVGIDTVTLRAKQDVVAPQIVADFSKQTPVAGDRVSVRVRVSDDLALAHVRIVGDEGTIVDDEIASGRDAERVFEHVVGATPSLIVIEARDRSGNATTKQLEYGPQGSAVLPATPAADPPSPEAPAAHGCTLARHPRPADGPAFILIVAAVLLARRRRPA
jgi:hypothetical protein